jgi:hypothetical protein
MVKYGRGANRASLFTACASVLSAATEEILSTFISSSFHLQPSRASFVWMEIGGGVVAAVLIRIMSAPLGSHPAGNAAHWLRLGYS